MSNQIYVSDSSPIIFLSKIHKLDLLQKIFKKVYIPAEVYKEITQGKSGKYDASIAGAKEVTSAGWIECKEVRERSVVNTLAAIVDLGEAEAIALAREMNAQLLVIDDNDGRTAARQYGVKVAGTLGILKLAKDNGFLTEVRPLVLKLISLQGKDKFRISAAVIRKSLTDNNEWYENRDSFHELKSAMLSGRQYNR